MQQHREEPCNPKWVIFETFLTNFREPDTGKVRRTHLLGTSANKGKKRKGRGIAAPAPASVRTS
jgi:hypothetical protein